MQLEELHKMKKLLKMNNYDYHHIINIYRFSGLGRNHQYRVIVKKKKQKKKIANRSRTFLTGPWTLSVFVQFSIKTPQSFSCRSVAAVFRTSVITSVFAFN